MSKSASSHAETAVVATRMALESCLDTKNAKAILASLSNAQVSLENALEVMPKRTKSYIPVRKSLTALSNAVGSLHAGVESRDLSLTEFRSNVGEVQKKFVPRALASIRGVAPEDDSKLEEDSGPQGSGALDKQLIIRSSDFKAALSEVKRHLGKSSSVPDSQEAMDAMGEIEKHEQIYRSREQKEEDEMKRRLAYVQSLKTKIPVRIKGAYQLFRFPVVPIFDAGILSGKKPTGRSDLTRNFSSSRLLESLGIKHIMIQDYLILEDQFLIAVNTEDVNSHIAQQEGDHNSSYNKKLQNYREQVKTLKKQGVDKEDIPLHLERPKKGKAQVDPLDFVKSVLEVLNEKSPSKYALVTDQVVPNPRNTNVLFYWIMPRKTLSALIRKGWQKVKNWGFPW